MNSIKYSPIFLFGITLAIYFCTTLFTFIFNTYYEFQYSQEPSWLSFKFVLYGYLFFCFGYILIKRRKIFPYNPYIVLKPKHEILIDLFLAFLLLIKVFTLKAFPPFSSFTHYDEHLEISLQLRQLPVGILGLCLGLTVTLFSLKIVQKKSTKNPLISALSYLLIFAHALFEIKRLIFLFFLYIFLMVINFKKIKAFIILLVTTFIASLLFIITSIRTGLQSSLDNILSLMRYFEYSVVNTNYLLQNEPIPLFKTKGFIIFFLQILPARVFENYRRYLPETAVFFPRDAAMGLFGDCIFQLGFIGFFLMLFLYGIYFKILYIYKTRSVGFYFLYIYSSFTLVVATAFNLIFNLALVIIPVLLIALFERLKIIKETV